MNESEKKIKVLSLVLNELSQIENEKNKIAKNIQTQKSKLPSDFLEQMANLHSNEDLIRDIEKLEKGVINFIHHFSFFIAFFAYHLFFLCFATIRLILLEMKAIDETVSENYRTISTNSSLITSLTKEVAKGIFFWPIFFFLDL